MYAQCPCSVFFNGNDDNFVWHSQARYIVSNDCCISSFWFGPFRLVGSSAKLSISALPNKQMLMLCFYSESIPFLVGRKFEMYAQYWHLAFNPRSSDCQIADFLICSLFVHSFNWPNWMDARMNVNDDSMVYDRQFRHIIIVRCVLSKWNYMFIICNAVFHVVSDNSMLRINTNAPKSWKWMFCLSFKSSGLMYA